MKRGDIVFTLLVILILLISISFVSAGLLGDAWNKITGKVTENITDGTETSPIEEEICGDDICQEGEVCDIDCCEAFCTLECPNGAVEGSCGCECILEPEPPIEEICGDDICQEGEVCDIDCCHNNYCELYCPNGAVEGSCGCECIPELPLDDKECEEGEMRYYGCPDGTKVPNCECESNMWVCKIFKDENCPNDGPEPKTCAAKIQITFNKDSYKVGDGVKIIIEIFDSQGNHVPNYAFYAQMYDDRWHTPDLQKTDSKGYFIVTTTAEKPAGGVTEVKFKVYTKETSSCGSVEDIAEVKFELKECGIGGCVPKPECKDKIRMCGGACTPCPEDDGDGEIFYACSGCELEDKCYPMGYRKEGQYCSENYEFVEQLDGVACDNSFECKSNVCVSGECIGEGLMEKIIAWFNKLFGGDADEEPKDCSKVLIEEDIGDYEYKQTLYGPGDAQVPIYSEEGEQKEIVKCCAAQYQSQDGKEGMGVVCPLGDKKEVQNSIKWLLAHNTRLSLSEHKGEKVVNDNNKVVAWTSNKYIVATGIDDTIFDAYLKEYPNDFDLTEDDIPYISPIPPLPDEESKSFVFCTEEDKNAAKECGHGGGAPQSDPSTFDGTEESKKKCKESKGFGEGCCEVYTGCIMPYEDCEEIKIVSRDECYWHVAALNDDADLCEKISDSYYKDKCLRDVTVTIQDSSACEKIDDREYRNKCYINVAEHTGDANLCDKVSDSDLQEKCYFWVAGETGEEDSCAGITDVDLQTRCYGEVAEKTGDAGYCAKMADKHIADKCYRDVGIQTNDKSLCEKIIETQAKQKCLDNTS